MDTAGSLTLEPEQDLEVEIEKQKQAVKTGANWFYWIAGLSVVNSVIQLFQGEWGFILGLGITQVIDAIASIAAGEAGGNAAVVLRVIALLLDLVVAGVFVLFGWLANQHKGWAFGLGMTLYTLDALIFLVVQDWLGLGFHAFVLFCLYTGFAALKKLRGLERQRPGAAIEPVSA